MGALFTDKDMGFDKLVTEFQLAKGEKAVFVGFLRSSGVHKKGDGMTVAQLGAIHEFGSQDGRIPERSFIRATIDANAGQIQRLVDKCVLQVTDGKMQVTKALGLVGEFLRGKMVAMIDAGVPPPNAPSTVARKGSDKPLIDTGQLKGSIEWEVKEGT